MAFNIKWDESYSVCVKELDAQHQKLIQVLNELSDAMTARKKGDILGKVLNDLVDYAEVHFQTEEKYFNKFDYPDTAIHTSQHNDFVRHVSDFRKGFDEGRLLLSLDVMQFLNEWLINHIKGSDKNYAKFFNEKGLT